MTILRTVYWYVYFDVSILYKTPELNKVRKQKNNMEQREYEALINKVVVKWAKKQIRNSGARIKVAGEENIPKEHVLFVSNHQSNFDIAVFIACINKDKGFIAKTEMLKIPLLRDWMTELRCVFMDRSDIKKSAKAILEGIEILKSGYSMVVFPEGTRSKGNTLGEFKAGSFKLATKSGVPIVPVTIDGTYKIMEENNNKIKPADVNVTIHKPIYVNALSKEELTALPEKVKEIIESKLKA